LQCPHWGYVFAGMLTVRYGERVETIEAGEAFYLPPGHVPTAVAGTEFVQFSPAEQLRISEEAMARNMQARMQGG
jgi:quercetin dioxygenase-like cupin family protein